MRWPSQWIESSKLPVAVLLLAVVSLPVLAVLQYRWIGQVSQAEQGQMRQKLRESVDGFERSFDGTLTEVYTSALVMRPGEGGAKNGEFASRIERWRNDSSHAALVKAFYFVERTGEHEVSLQRYNDIEQGFEPCEWPAELAPLRLSLALRLESPQKFDQGHGRRPPARGGPAEEFEPPVLVAPEVISFEAATPGGGTARQFRFRGLRLAVLDEQYLEGTLLPQAASRYFSDSLEAIVFYRDRVLYPAGSKASIASFPGEISGRIFSIRPERANARQPMRGPARFSGQFPPPPDDNGPGSRGGPDERPRWTVRVRHREGPLAEVIEHARLRNIAVSSAILLVMAASIGVLVIAIRRARRLADLQMEFVTSVSHELRTPLSVICSAADNLEAGIVRHEAQARKYGTLISKESRRLAEMVDQILNFSSIEDGRTRLAMQPVDVAGVIRQVEATHEHLISESGCAVETRVDANLPPVAGDAKALEQAVQNLLVNALKYGRDGKWVGIGAVRQNGSIAITVEDRGAGIDSSELPHLFEPFYRGQRAIADQIHGTGLGLSLVKRIVEAHGGSVAAESPQPTEPRGAKFTILLPVQ
jgi:signal transduction histidine kinase